MRSPGELAYTIAPLWFPRANSKPQQSIVHMAAAKTCLAHWSSRSSLALHVHSQTLPLRIFLPSLKVRAASGSSQSSQKFKKKEAPKKRKPRNTFKQYDLKDADQFALCDAMRYVSPTLAAFTTAPLIEMSTYIISQLYSRLRSWPSSYLVKIRDAHQAPHTQEWTYDSESHTATTSRKYLCPDLRHMPSGFSNRRCRHQGWCDCGWRGDCL